MGEGRLGLFGFGGGFLLLVWVWVFLFVFLSGFFFPFPQRNNQFTVFASSFNDFKGINALTC